MRSPGFSLSSILHVSCVLETTASHLCASVSLSEVKRPDSALLWTPPALISQESSEGSADEGTQLQEGDAPSGARAWQATGAEAAGERLPPREGAAGGADGEEDGSSLGRGLCHHLLHHPHPHSGFWAEPGFKNSNYQFFSYQQGFVSKGAHGTWSRSEGPRDAASVLGCRETGSHGATQQGGKDQVRALLVTGPFFASLQEGLAPSCGTGRDPSPARSLGQLAVPSGSARSLSRVGLRPPSAE